MQINYYSVYDCVADEYGPLFPHRNDNSAYRAYLLGLKDKDENEYQLWFIGTFEDSYIEAPQPQNRFVADNSHQVFADREEQ